MSWKGEALGRGGRTGAGGWDVVPLRHKLEYGGGGLSPSVAMVALRPFGGGGRDGLFGGLVPVGVASVVKWFGPVPSPPAAYLTVRGIGLGGRGATLGLRGTASVSPC